MNSEYQYRYQTPEAKEVDKNHKDIGPKELSGFVTNKEKEDVISFLPGFFILIIFLQLR